MGPFTLKAGNRVRIGNDVVLRVESIRPLRLSVLEGDAEIVMHTNRKRGILRGTLKCGRYSITLRIRTDGNLALISFLNIPQNVPIRTMPKEILRTRQPQSA